MFSTYIMHRYFYSAIVIIIIASIRYFLFILFILLSVSTYLHNIAFFMTQVFFTGSTAGCWFDSSVGRNIIFDFLFKV